MKYKATLGKSAIEYDSDTGVFIWLLCYRKPWMNGRIASHKTGSGYLYIKANRQHYSCSRLAWTLVYNHCDLALEIDHENRDKIDNRISNLRLTTRQLNLANREFKKNRVGVTGVSLHKGGLYRARHASRTTYHKTIEEAAASYAEMHASYVAGYAKLCSRRPAL